MPFAPVNSIELYYESHGEGPAVVFAHGRGGNHLSWWQQVPFFRERYRCITFDHREFGQSKETPGGPGRAGFVDDLRCLLDHIGIDRTYLVGQSMGGGTVLGFALRYPQRVLGLVLADTPAGIAEEDMLRDFRARAPSLPEDASVRAQSERFRRSDPAKAFLYYEIGLLSKPVRETFVQYITATDGPTASDLADFRVPTLVIVGREDIVVTPDNAAMVCRHIPGARLAVVEEAGHSVYWEKPQEFNKLVGSFFETIKA